MRKISLHLVTSVNNRKRLLAYPWMVKVEEEGKK